MEILVIQVHIIRALTLGFCGKMEISTMGRERPMINSPEVIVQKAIRRANIVTNKNFEPQLDEGENSSDAFYTHEVESEFCSRQSTAARRIHSKC